MQRRQRYKKATFFQIPFFSYYKLWGVFSKLRDPHKKHFRFSPSKISIYIYIYISYPKDPCMVYLIFTSISPCSCGHFSPKLGKYSIHGSYGIYLLISLDTILTYKLEVTAPSTHASGTGTPFEVWKGNRKRTSRRGFPKNRATPQIIHLNPFNLGFSEYKLHLFFWSTHMYLCILNIDIIYVNTWYFSL